jgi:DHHW protein
MKKKNPTIHIPSLVNIEAFCIVLLGGCLLTWLEPKLLVSEIEKRELTPFPVFSMGKLMDGNYTDSLDLYYADHFAHREQWVDFTASVKGYFGFRKNDLMVYQSENPELAALDSLALVDSLAKAKSADGQLKIKKDPTGQPAEMKNSILIYNGMAFQLFGRQTEAEINFATTVNSYKQKLGDSVRVFACVVPSPIDFYLPDEFKSRSNQERPSIDFIYSKLNSDVLEVDAYGLLENSTDDFIYFKTDHHWTARGAYRAYQAFCARAGFEAADLTTFERHKRKTFLGSLYYATLDTRLKKSGDSLEYFIPPIETQAWRYPDRNLQKAIPTEVVSKRLGQGGSYLTFLGGDYPLTHIITQNKNGRKVMMIKDSYGNAFAPFLTTHYEEIFVVDYRSFDSNVIRFLVRHNISDLLFLHNVAIVNTKYTASRESYLMRIGDLKPRLTNDTTEVTNK